MSLRPSLAARLVAPTLISLLAAVPLAAPAVAWAATAAPLTAPTDAATIVAVVNGDVISREDVINRSLLFAHSTGLPTSPEVLERIAPQVTRQLIDERLRLQEIQRRHIVVSDQEIAKTIADVESRNNMAPGTLEHRLAADGVALRTLIDQIRVQIGWGRVLRQELGSRLQVSDADLAEQERLKFADTVISQLREGAPFPVAAAQFSQSQTALQGGDLGWVQSDQLDPAELRVVSVMPVGAISNPIRVPGGLSIVTLRGKRQIGQDVVTQLTIRQAFVHFTSALNPQAPTPQQIQALTDAKALSASAHDCDAVAAANTRWGSGRPSDPGPITLENVAPAMRGILDKLEPGHASQPLVAQDGIAVLMVCSRETRNAGLPSKAELEDRILGERIELASRQLQNELRRRAIIEQRS
jgi:peptidyl-prolyl cis-trans isomerase SurA